VLARRHHVVVAGVRDPDLDRAVRTPPVAVRDVLAASVVVEASTPGPGWRPSRPGRRRGAGSAARPARRGLRRRLPAGQGPKPALSGAGHLASAQVGRGASGGPARRPASSRGGDQQADGHRPGQRRLVGVTNPSTRPASTNHGIVPARSPPPPGAEAEGHPAAAAAGVDQRPATRTRRPLTAITDSSSTPWATNDRKGRTAGRHRQPARHRSGRRCRGGPTWCRPRPGSRPRRPRRHLDVVGQDLAGQGGLAAERQPQIAPAVLPTPRNWLEETAGGSRVGGAQAPTSTAGTTSGASTADQADPLPDEPPVAPERKCRSDVPGSRWRRRGAGTGRRGPPAGRSSGRRATAAGPGRDRPPLTGTSTPAAVPGGPSCSGAGRRPRPADRALPLGCALPDEGVEVHVVEEGRVGGRCSFGLVLGFVGYWFGV